MREAPGADSPSGAPQGERVRAGLERTEPVPVPVPVLAVPPDVATLRYPGKSPLRRQPSAATAVGSHSRRQPQPPPRGWPWRRSRHRYRHRDRRRHLPEPGAGLCFPVSPADAHLCGRCAAGSVGRSCRWRPWRPRRGPRCGPGAVPVRSRRGPAWHGAARRGKLRFRPPRFRFPGGGGTGRGGEERRGEEERGGGAGPYLAPAGARGARPSSEGAGHGGPGSTGHGEPGEPGMGSRERRERESREHLVEEESRAPDTESARARWSRGQREQGRREHC